MLGAGVSLSHLSSFRGPAHFLARRHRLRERLGVRQRGFEPARHRACVDRLLRREGVIVIGPITGVPAKSLGLSPPQPISPQPEVGAAHVSAAGRSRPAAPAGPPLLRPCSSRYRQYAGGIRIADRAPRGKTGNRCRAPIPGGSTRLRDRSRPYGCQPPCEANAPYNPPRSAALHRGQRQRRPALCGRGRYRYRRNTAAHPATKA